MLALPRCVFALAILAITVNIAPGQMTPDQQAEMILNAARRAFNDRNYPVAVSRFREFTQKFGSHKDRPAAQYGLALSFLEGPNKDYQGALAELTPLAGNQGFAEHAFVLYYLGLANRGLGVRSLAQAVAKPNEASTLRNAAHQHFEEAGKRFAEAWAAFDKRAPKPEAGKELPLDLEWACRAHCDQAEMLLRVGRAKDVKPAVAPLLTRPLLQKSRYHKLALYYDGFASFLLKDYRAAAKALDQLAPFSDPVFGTHARYLLARIHHHANDRQEALTHYQGLLADHDKLKLAAAEQLRQPDRFKNDPEEKARLEALVKAAPPDHVARAIFFLGVLQYENGQFGEALSRFSTYPRDFPVSSLLGEAILRQGFCQVQLKMWADAQKTLQPLVDREPRLADQCLLWLGKAQLGAADPNNKPAHDQAVKQALDLFRQGAERANQMVAADPQARLRRGECLLEMADTQQLAGHFREAATTYNQVLNDKLLAGREEELYHCLAVSWQLAGDFKQSDAACNTFISQFPKSVLLPTVLFRHAENAYFEMLAAEKANKVNERNQLADEMQKRYQVVVDKFPDFPLVHLARFGVAVAQHRKGELDKALERLEAIPVAERTDDLAVVPYLVADCLIRQAPAKTDDAESAAKCAAQFKRAIELLEGFISNAPNHPQAADALIKLGHCQQRLAAQGTEPQERARHLAVARTAYEQVLQRFPKSEQQPLAIFERAKVLASAKDVNGAINDLRRFTKDPLKATPVAPMAILSLATLLRSQGKAQEAADALFQCRLAHEQKLAAAPATAAIVPLLQYQHGLALREAGREADARAILESLARNFPDRPEAQDAGLRAAQCLKDEAMKKIAAGHKKLAIPGLPPAEAQAAKQSIDAGYAELRSAVTQFGNAAEQLRQRAPMSELRARMLYEAAWACRLLAEPEVDAGRVKVQQELIQKRLQELAKGRQPGLPPLQPHDAGPPPEVPLALVPVQNTEKQAHGFYQTLISAFPDLALNAEARFELAEMLSERNEHDNAIKLLKEALDKKPATDLADKVRVRLAAAYLAKGEGQEALEALKPVVANDKSPVYAQALYRAGECYLFLKEPAEAVKRLSAFRDQGPLQNLPGLSDRALLRLGHAYAQQNQWDQSRQSLDGLVARFPTSSWVPEARYGAAWAFQKQGQYDQAVAIYQKVIDTVATELAAQAQIQIGLCRMAQQRFADAGTALLVVPYTYDYPQLSALALMEAARAFSANKQEGQAVRLLERVIKDHPNSEHAEVARKRLTELRKG